jgi:hypothetical protein
MAITRHLYPPAQTFQPRLVEIVGRVAIGSSGAVGAQTGKGFSVTRTGTGLYKVTIDTIGGAVGDILHADARLVFATGSTVQGAKVLTISPSTAAVTLQTDGSTPGTAADPASGSFLEIRIIVQNSGQAQ